MKKLSTLLVSILLIISVNSKAQENAFTVNAFSDFSYIDLTNASETNVGTVDQVFGGMDFGPENILYGLNHNNNKLYSVDTSDATTTLIGSSVPAADHIWTGMAFDYATGIMYANASHGIAAGSSKLYTIDVTDGSVSLVGTQTDVTAFGAIAMDDDGQLYGLQLSASPSIYLIDKTDASVTWLGDCNEFGGAGMGYGMDYNSEDQTMYLTAYDSFTFNNDLYTIDLTDGGATQVGSLTAWTLVLAIISPFSADFYADETNICNGTTVNFTDNSTGAVEWDWTFEGGTPATSTEQNPSVEYENGGTFNVSLTITNASDNTQTETKVDYITVLETPLQASTPEGDEGVCTGGFYNYSIEEILYAEDYEWELEPADAGTLEVNDNDAALTVADDWTGDFTLRARATNMCADGEWSEYLNGTVYVSPEEFTVEGGGGYCLGGDGVEITLSGSQSGVDYELYLGSDPTGNIVEGTGDEISFGLLTEDGYYSVIGSNDYCEQTMMDQVEVEVLYPPLEPDAPTGPQTVCADETSDYEGEGTNDADSYAWVLTPEEAGTITSVELDATVVWNAEFSGTATVAFYGINDCGEGNTGTDLEVDVNAIPAPAIEGDDLVCDNHSGEYSVPENDGSTYTWTVTAGTITDGEGTYMITVMWGDAGMGTVSVEELTEAGCVGTSVTFDVTIDDCTGINENGETGIEKIYPNPANNVLNIQAKLAAGSESSIIIHNQLGQVVKEIKMNGSENLQTITFDISELPKGLYVVSINNSGASNKQQFIKK